MLRSKRIRALILAGGVALLATAGGAQMQPIGPGTLLAAVERLQPGQFLWAPEVAPDGPMLVMVNVNTQRLIAYRNGVPVAVSTISTGRAGHRTPMGTFTVLQKAVVHHSSKYSNAPMPYMQRLTMNGIALHGGTLPGYPASHGCIRLPHEFAKLLFGETALGMTVVIVDQPTQLRLGPTAQALRTLRPAAYSGPAYWRPDLSPYGPVSIVVSAADRRMVVLRNGVEIGSAPVAFNGEVDEMQAYMLHSVADGRYDWRRLILMGQSAETGNATAMPGGQALQGTDPFRQALATVIGPGTTMIVIPDSLGIGGAAQQPIATIGSERVVARWLSDTQLTGGR